MILFERLFQIANPFSVLMGLLFASDVFGNAKRRSVAEQETHSAAERFWAVSVGILWLIRYRWNRLTSCGIWGSMCASRCAMGTWQCWSMAASAVGEKGARCG